MYLRLGWVVGNAGLVGTIIIILIAHVISITTGLSVSSIATDKKVKAGGIYYMLSRSLGLPIGGSIGIALFVATALSIAMYIVGFAESLNSVIGLNYVDMDPLERVNNLRITGTITLVLVSTIAMVSTSLAIKTQYYILGAIVLSLVSIFAGGLLVDHGFTPESIALFPGASSENMETIFAIFFPAVTGFTAGVAMSGDLKDPKKSIPVGTMAAVAVGLVVYIGLAVFLASVVNPTILREDTNVLSKIALLSAYGAPFLMAGIWGATLSSALGGILGGPRILQAMSLDRVTPRLFGKGVGKSNEPRNALILAFIIAEAGILIGELDLIAPIVSMFYLTAYGFINLTCALESWSGSEFRPSFTIHRSISWIGALATFAVMFKLDMLAMFASFIVIGLIFLYLTRKQITLGFSDVWQGVWSEVMRMALSRISQSETDKRSWRPNIILFSGSTDRRPYLLEFGTRLVGKMGLLSNFDLVEDPGAPGSFTKRQKVVDSSDAKGVFTRQYTCNDLYSGIERIAETYGFSGLDPNTILLGWARYSKHPVQFSKLISRFQQLDFSLLIMDYDQRMGFGKHERIDIWCEGNGRHLTFMLTIARFLQSSDDWHGAEIRLIVVADTSQVDDLIIHQTLNQVQEDLRVSFEVKLINTALVQQTLYEIIKYESAEADLVCLELPELHEGQEKTFFEKTDALCKEIGTVLFYKASTEFEEIDLSLKKSSLETIAAVESADLNYSALPSAAIPDIKLPEHAEMADLIKKIEQQSKDLSLELYQEFLIPFTNKQVQIIQSVQARIEAFYMSQQPEDTSESIPESIQSLEQLLRELIQTLEEQQFHKLKSMEQTLVAAADQMADRIQLMVEQAPRQYSVNFNREQLKDVSLTGFNVLNRIQHLFGTDTIQYQLKYQQLIRVLLVQDFRKAQVEIFRQIVNDSKQFGNALRKSIRRMAAGVMELRKANKEDLPGLLKRELQQINQRCYDLESKTGAQANRYRDYLFNEASSRLDQVSAAMNQLTLNRYVAKQITARRQWAALDTQLRETVSNWKQNQLLDYNVSTLELRLLLAKAELDRAFAQIENNLMAIPDRKVFQPTERLIQLLKQLVSDVEKGRQLKLTSSYKAGEFSDLGESIGRFVSSCKEISEELPGKLKVPNLNQATNEESSDELEAIEISPSNVVNYVMQSNLTTPMEAEAGPFQMQLSKADHTLSDVMQVVNLAIEGTAEEGDIEMSESKLKETIEGEISRLEQGLERVIELVEKESLSIQERYQKVLQNMDARSVIKAAVDFDYYLMSQKQSQVINKFSSLSRSLRSKMLSGVTNLYYRRSEGLIAARRFKDSYELEDDWKSRMVKAIISVSPKSQVMEDLPFYYKQLFLRPHSVSRDLWLTKDEDLVEAQEAVTIYQNVRSGALLVLGSPLSGKTYLSELVADQFTESEQVHTVNAPGQGSIDRKTFHRAIKKGLRYYGALEAAFDHLQDNSVVVFNNIEQWWERSEEGFSVLHDLLTLVDRYSNRILFILNMGIQSYRLVNRIYGMDEHFFKVLRTSPYNAEELKQIILTRHNTSRLKFVLDGKHQDTFGEFKLAKLFTRYFDQSDGNIGVALQQWICSIQQVHQDGRIEISNPKPPDREAFNHLDKDRVIILIQFILHRKLNEERLARIMQSSGDELRRSLEVLGRMDILRRKNGIWEVNRYLLPFLMEELEEDLLI